ncbi:MAG: alcohol dehydrogenase catalytic domain-containing protein [Armatimonadota bacterium]|nr:alcohol dehydrogenase catalytic domain-containing protein [Armatimonadota bacterium]MDR7533458.1 alcohol dehydrogenase catalytic domain-containing protein [Armatimonadota bacterium]MDR7536271.1 alcohol dehydrogenase catalytic domain-containing protein [Armatimonadota bacterium]
MRATRPGTTQAVVWHAPGDLRLEDLPLPALGPGDALLRITACGLCPGETMDWYMARRAPAVLGHEAVGVVVETGPGAACAPGTRLFVHHHAPCLVCAACRRGAHVHCAAWRARRLLPGGLATYAVARADAVATDAHVLPADLDDETATFIEPLACVVKSLRRARMRPGDRVLVLGLGVMGLLHLLVARRLGPAVLIGADRLASRAETARPLADVVVDASRDVLPDAVRAATGDGADVVIVGPGSVEALDAGVACAAPGATVLLFTPTPPEVRWALAPHDLFFREISLVASYSAGPDETREAVRLLAAGLPVQGLITHRLALADAARGYALLRSAAALKVVVRP